MNKIDISEFPYDINVLDVAFESWIMDTSRLKYKIGSNYMSDREIEPLYNP